VKEILMVLVTTTITGKNMLVLVVADIGNVHNSVEPQTRVVVMERVTHIGLHQLKVKTKKVKKQLETAEEVVVLQDIRNVQEDNR
jgi:hypothetical protein